MSIPGWYPDPAGTPNRFRYWDGSAWSQQTTDDPRNGPPEADGSQTKPPSRSRGPLIAIAAIVLVLIIVGVFVVRALFGPGDGIVDYYPTSTVSGWNDSSPFDTPTPTPTPSATRTPTPSRSPSPSPTLSPSPSGSGTIAPLTSCPYALDDERDYPDDGRVHGGGLSFPIVADWDAPRTEYGISWASDAHSQRLITEPGWFALLAVGSLSKSDGFVTPQQAAESVMQCTATSGFYSNFEERKDVWSKAATIDGHPAWTVRAEILVDRPELSVDGDLVDATVVDLGDGHTLSLFLGAVSVGDSPRITVMNTTIDALRAD